MPAPRDTSRRSRAANIGSSVVKVAGSELLSSVFGDVNERLQENLGVSVPFDDLQNIAAYAQENGARALLKREALQRAGKRLAVKAAQQATFGALRQEDLERAYRIFAEKGRRKEATKEFLKELDLKRVALGAASATAAALSGGAAPAAAALVSNSVQRLLPNLTLGDIGKKLQEIESAAAYTPPTPETTPPEGAPVGVPPGPVSPEEEARRKAEFSAQQAQAIRAGAGAVGAGGMGATPSASTPSPAGEEGAPAPVPGAPGATRGERAAELSEEQARARQEQISQRLQQAKETTKTEGVKAGIGQMTDLLKGMEGNPIQTPMVAQRVNDFFITVVGPATWFIGTYIWFNVCMIWGYYITDKKSRVFPALTWKNISATQGIAGIFPDLILHALLVVLNLAILALFIGLIVGLMYLIQAAMDAAGLGTKVYLWWSQDIPWDALNPQ